MRVRSPYPVAALLSGGLDSSAVVAAAARVLQHQNRRLITLSAVLPPDADAGVRDEKEYIDAFQGWPNVDLIDITDPQRGPFDDLERLMVPHSLIPWPCTPQRDFPPRRQLPGSQAITDVQL